ALACCAGAERGGGRGAPRGEIPPGPGVAVPCPAVRERRLPGGRRPAVALRGGAAPVVLERADSGRLQTRSGGEQRRGPARGDDLAESARGGPGGHARTLRTPAAASQPVRGARADAADLLVRFARPRDRGERARLAH